MKAPKSVLQEWVCKLTFMQQSVLIASMRGPDGMPKDHVSKLLIRWLRRCVLYSAFESQIMGRPAVFFNPYEPGGGSFTGPSIPDRSSVRGWATDMDKVLTDYLATLDAVPHHFQLHFMHAAEILGYKHPVVAIGDWWFGAYRRLANDMHLNIETPEQMDRRLGDNENDWRAAEEVVAKGPDLGPLRDGGTATWSGDGGPQNIQKKIDIDNRASCPTCSSTARTQRKVLSAFGPCPDHWHDTAQLCPTCGNTYRGGKGPGRLSLDCKDSWHDVQTVIAKPARDGVCDVARDAMRELHGDGDF